MHYTCKTEVGFCGFAEPHASVVARVEGLPLPLTGNGNESGVDWRRTEETDENALVVNSVDNCGTDCIRVIH